MMMMKLALTFLAVLFVAVTAQEKKPWPGPMNGMEGWTMGDAVPQLVTFMQALAAPGAEPAIGAVLPYDLAEPFEEDYGEENGSSFKVASIEYSEEEGTLFATYLVMEYDKCLALFSIACPIVAYTEEEKMTGLEDANPIVAFMGDNSLCEDEDFEVLRVDYCNTESPHYSEEECDGHEEDRETPARR
jgi:hypothetical protein